MKKETGEYVIIPQTGGSLGRWQAHAELLPSISVAVVFLGFFLQGSLHCYNNLASENVIYSLPLNLFRISPVYM